LYGARKQLQVRKFQQPWMRMTAMGITEQTYNSTSKLKPAAVGRLITNNACGMNWPSDKPKSPT
jgi:hypothetical protein